MKYGMAALQHAAIIAAKALAKRLVFASYRGDNKIIGKQSLS